MVMGNLAPDAPDPNVWGLAPDDPGYELSSGCV